MITFGTIPRSFNALYFDIQYKAIRSWRRFGEIILFGDDMGTEEASLDLACTWYYDVKRRSVAGPPLIDSVFADLQRMAQTDIVCYINSDILLYNDDVACVIENVHNALGAFLAVGRRWDVDVPHTRITHEAQVFPSGHHHCVHGEDYFFFTNGAFPFVPPFLIGRSAWDNWLVMDAQRRGIPVVDVTDGVQAIHLGKTKAHHDASPEYSYNQDIWRKYGGKKDAGYVDSAEYVYTDGKVLHREKL